MRRNFLIETWLTQDCNVISIRKDIVILTCSQIIYEMNWQLLSSLTHGHNRFKIVFLSFTLSVDTYEMLFVYRPPM